MKKRWYNCWLLHTWSDWKIDIQTVRSWRLSAIGEPQRRNCLICGDSDARIAKYR